MHVLIFYSFLTQFKEVLLSDVMLTAPSYVRVGERFKLNCSSSSTPQIQSAEFLLNSRTLTNIGSRKGTCFNALSSVTCVPWVCHCSADGRSYIFIYQLSAMTTTNVFECKMKISNTGMELSNNVTTKIVEVPQMILNDSFYCNASSAVTLMCRVHGGSNDFGFSSWEHYFNGTFIRQLKGFVQGKLSVLQINSCTFQDTGQYVCHSWSKFADGNDKTNITTRLFVAERPVIINKTTTQKADGLKFIVFLYSHSTILSVKWYLKSHIIPNISEYKQDTERIGVDLPIHGQQVQAIGLKSSLLCSWNSYSNKKFTVCATNEYGEVCDDIEVKGNTKIPNNSKLFFIIGGLVTVVLIIGLIIVIVTIHNRIKTQVHTSLTQVNTDRSQQAEATQSSTSALSDHVDISQYVQTNSPVHEAHSYHRASYICDTDSFLQKTDTTGIMAVNEYLEVEPDSSVSSDESDGYEKVD